MHKEKFQKSLLRILYENNANGALEEALEHDTSYQQASKVLDKKIDAIHEQLDHMQWKEFENVLSAYNISNIAYGKVAYQQGFQDALILLTELGRV